MAVNRIPGFLGGQGSTQDSHAGSRKLDGVALQVTCANALTFETDVLVLKYAQMSYGADAAVTARLRDARVVVDLPAQGFSELVDSRGAVQAKKVMFVGVEQLRQFGYRQIREFARQALQALKATDTDCKTIAFTIHGPGYGLDENEAFDSLLAGILDSIESAEIPQTLEGITFVELVRARATRLQNRLDEIIPDRFFAINSDLANAKQGAATVQSESLRSAGYGSASKPHVFVAMPFAPEMDDTFHYGIQGASNTAGYLCERADLSAFTGDVLEWVKTRIASAKLVIADLSSANPNVYLEVGYAWGCRVPTVLLSRDANDLKFDVRGQRCIEYKTIKELEGKLAEELAQLNSAAT